MSKESLDAQQVLAEAKALIKAAFNTSSAERNQLILWAKESLMPLAAESQPEARWLLCSIPTEGSADLTAEEFDRRFEAEVRAAAQAGSAAAQFHLACRLDEEPTVKESAELFRAAAEQGHAYAKWCYGLNLIGGRGTVKDPQRGLRYIEEAAAMKFEGAIQFLSHAYGQGTYGYQKDEALAAAWWAKLRDEDLIRF